MSSVPHHHDHDHAHDDNAHASHRHGGHNHGVGAADLGHIFILGIGLNIFIVIIEAAAGLWGHSMSLLADAGHNLSDVLGLGLAWVADILCRRPPTPRYTYGLRATSILAALFNGLFLMAVIGALSLEAIQRFFAPEPVGGATMIAVAAAGMVVNGFVAMLFASRRHTDLNIRGAFLHMLSDAAISAGVVVTGIAILFTGLLWLDPAVSLAINVIILFGTWDLLRESIKMSLAAVPSSIKAVDVRSYLAALPQVTALHDLHIWAMSTSETALTAHLVMPQGHPGDAFLTDVQDVLRKTFGIGHATLQVETDPNNACALAPDDKV